MMTTFESDRSLRVSKIERSLLSSRKAPLLGSKGELTSTLYNTVRPARRTSSSDKTVVTFRGTSGPSMAIVGVEHTLSVPTIPFIEGYRAVS